MDGQLLRQSILTTIHYSGTADGHSPHVHVNGLHGVGLVAVNALCELFICRAWRGGKLWEQRFSREWKSLQPRLLKKAWPWHNVEFIPDPEIFGAFEDLLAFAVLEERRIFTRGLRFIFKMRFCFPDGLAELVRAKLHKVGQPNRCSQQRSSGDVEYLLPQQAPPMAIRNGGPGATAFLCMNTEATRPRL